MNSEIDALLAIIALYLHKAKGHLISTYTSNLHPQTLSHPVTALPPADPPAWIGSEAGLMSCDGSRVWLAKARSGIPLTLTNIPNPLS